MKLPNNQNNDDPCNSPLSAMPPPTQKVPAREPAAWTAVELAEWRKVAAWSKQALAKASLLAGGARGAGVQKKSMWRWRRGKCEWRKLPPDARRKKEKIMGRVRLCNDWSGPHVEPGQHPSIQSNASNGRARCNSFTCWNEWARGLVPRHSLLLPVCAPWTSCAMWTHHMKEACARACAILSHHSWDKLAPANAFSKTGPLCRVCYQPSLPDQLSQWARSGLHTSSLV